LLIVIGSLVVEH